MYQCELIYRDETTCEWLKRLKHEQKIIDKKLTQDELNSNSNNTNRSPTSYEEFRASLLHDPATGINNLWRFFGDNIIELLNLHRRVPTRPLIEEN